MKCAAKNIGLDRGEAIGSHKDIELQGCRAFFAQFDTHLHCKIHHQAVQSFRIGDGLFESARMLQTLSRGWCFEV